MFFYFLFVYGAPVALVGAAAALGAVCGVIFVIPQKVIEFRDQQGDNLGDVIVWTSALVAAVAVVGVLSFVLPTLYGEGQSSFARGVAGNYTLFINSLWMVCASAFVAGIVFGIAVSVRFWRGR